MRISDLWERLLMVAIFVFLYYLIFEKRMASKPMID